MHRCSGARGEHGWLPSGAQRWAAAMSPCGIRSIHPSRKPSSAAGSVGWLQAHAGTCPVLARDSFPATGHSISGSPRSAGGGSETSCPRSWRQVAASREQAADRAPSHCEAPAAMHHGLLLDPVAHAMMSRRSCWLRTRACYPAKRCA